MLARSFLGNAPIIIWDEATNFLDEANQEQVMSQLEKLPATRIVIAHRLSALKNADRIYVMKDGKIEAVGTFNELKGTKGT